MVLRSESICNCFLDVLAVCATPRVKTNSNKKTMCDLRIIMGTLNISALKLSGNSKIKFRYFHGLISIQKNKNEGNHSRSRCRNKTETSYLHSTQGFDPAGRQNGPEYHC